ncbi:uncharacterized protein PAC_17107 [Phialocephala subalpina]|uniref:G domain-containing protein n=1 Tax=Phialocephala subalpina TaxID=576137 RepID=A0A1L7XQG7_9HELO|nr:uncharacterized protein PAC_17107 [Phialocephala subalpina]
MSNICSVVGETGSGKSTLINKIIGRDEVVIGHELESMTKTITAVTLTHQKKKIIFFDTPGFDDTYLPDAKVFQMIASFLRDLYERQVYVNGILYCHPIDNRRVTGSSRRQLEFMERLIGQKSLKNVIFVLTFADRMDYNRDLMDSRIGELKRTYWAPFLAKDARMFIKDGDGPPRALVDMVLRSQKTILDLQRELVDERRTLLRTSAGGTIKTESENKISYLEQELEALRKEIKDPATRKDPELVQEIRKLEDEVKSKLEIVKSELVSLDRQTDSSST